MVVFCNDLEQTTTAICFRNSAKSVFQFSLYNIFFIRKIGGGGSHRDAYSVCKPPDRRIRVKRNPLRQFNVHICLQYMQPAINSKKLAQELLIPINCFPVKSYSYRACSSACRCRPRAWRACWWWRGRSRRS